MATEGLRLTSFYSAPSCAPAHTQLMTGRYPPRVGLYVTLIETAGGELPDHPVDGHDLTPFLKGTTDTSPRDTFFYGGGGNFDGVRVGPWKLLLRDGVELFNLDIDPSERYNRVEEKPELVEALMQRMRDMAQEVGTTVPEPK